MTIEFNQPLVRPKFMEKSGRRELLDSNSVDMTKIIGLEFGVQSDANPERMQYFMEILEWGSNNLKLQISFADPSIISLGNRNDQMTMRIKNPSYFTSAATGEVYEEENQDSSGLDISVFQQLPKGVSEAELRSGAAAASNAASVLVIAQICMQLFMKGQIKNLLPLLFFLQISKSITIYKILVPAEIVIYIEEIRKFTDFESIDPNFLMKHFFDFDLQGYISSKKVQMTKASEMSGLKTGSILENLRIPIFIACVALMVLLLAVLAMVTIPPLRKKIQTILIDKKQ